MRMTEKLEGDNRLGFGDQGYTTPLTHIDQGYNQRLFYCGTAKGDRIPLPLELYKVLQYEMTAGSYCIVWRDNMQYILVCEKVKKGTKKHKLVKLVSTFHRGDSLTKCTRGQYKSSEIIVFYGPSQWGHYSNFGRG